MKTFRLLYLLLLFTLPVVASTNLQPERKTQLRVEEPLNFKSFNRNISVQSWRVTGLTENEQSDYYWLCLSAQINTKFKGLYDLGVQFIGTPDYSTKGLWVYLVNVHDKHAQAVELLKKEPSFITLISRNNRDKLSKGIASDVVGPGPLLARIEFDDSITIEDVQNLLDRSVDSVVSVSKSGITVSAIVFASTSALLCLANRDEVREIREYSMPRPTMDNSRYMMKVDSLQFGAGFDTTRAHFPPSSAWNANRDYTGEGIWVGVYDSGIDPLDSNFLEDNDGAIGGTTTLREAIPALSWQWPTVGMSGGAFHGTHVANIIGGNGWRSHLDGTHGTTFQWRGVAPKVKFISEGYSLTGNTGDVNNHSSTLDMLGGVLVGFYSPDSRMVDEELFNHDTTRANGNNVMVYAIGNNGIDSPPTYGNQKGIASLLVNPKNTIKVGAVQKYTGEQSSFSCMGPTRDGRIGPDVVAPGSGSIFVEKYRVDIDYIYWKSNVGTDSIKRGWDFTTKKNDNLPDSLWWSWGAGGVEKMWLEDGVFSMIGPQLTTNACIIYSDTIPSIYTDPTGAPNIDYPDSLIIRYRVVDSLSKPTFPMGQKRLITVAFGISLAWGLPRGNEMLLEANSGWQELRVRLSQTIHGTYSPPDHQGWPSNGQITRMSLMFMPTPIVSANRLHEGKWDYAPEQGTSMAAPQVTGVVALMLHKYGKTILGNINRIHTNPFWNSTAKAILAHTATDVIDTAMNFVACGQKPEYLAVGRNVANINGVGPDFGTGYGLVNAAKAVEYVSPGHFREDTVGDRLMRYYDMVVPPGTPKMKVTIAWDDPPASGPNDASTAFDSKLVNNLDLYLLPPLRDNVSRPWCLSDAYMRKPNMRVPSDGIDSSWINGVWTLGVSPDTIKAHPAYRGNDIVNNIEMVDVDNPASGTWTVVVEGRWIQSNQSVNGTTFEPKQDFSLVYDLNLTPNTTISNGGKDLVGMIFREGNNVCYARTTVVGNLQLCGVEQPGIPSGLRFKKYEGVPTSAIGFMPTTGNLVRSSMTAYATGWLSNSANLSGGLVFRNPGGQVVSHISMAGAMHIRGADFQSLWGMW